MDKIFIRYIWLLCCLIVTATTKTPSPADNAFLYEDSRVSMACTYSIAVYGSDEKRLRQIVNEAFDEVDRIDRLMSNYKKSSPLSQLNRDAAQRPVITEPELFDFIAECLRYSKLSDGAFDITVGPLMKAWGFFKGEGRYPSTPELNEARKNIGFRHLKLNSQKHTIQFDRRGIELDLGGIAKGYAVDCALAVLKKNGITSALISAGGSTIYALGVPPGKNGWEVKIQDPLKPDKIAWTLLLKNKSLSISGSSEKYFELNGKRYSHIMDPRTGRPVMNILSVAVLTETGTEGDALDNVFYVQGIKKSRNLLSKIRHLEVYYFLPDTQKSWKLVHLKSTK